MNALARLRIQHFRLLQAMGESATLHQAAERVRITQSAASKLLRDLEHAFDAHLFDRGRNGIRPTAGGQALLERTTRLLNDVEIAAQEQSRIREGGSALIRIGGLPIALVTLMPLIFGRCRATWPGLMLQTREATARQLGEDVLNGVVDCGLGRVNAAESATASDRPLVQDLLRPAELVVAARSSHPLARARRIEPEALLQHEWVVPPPGTVTRAALAEALQRVGLPLPPTALESDASFGTLLSFVREFGLLALVPGAVAERQGFGGGIRVLPVALDFRLPPLAFLCRRDRVDEPSLSRFRALVRAVGQPD